MIRTRLVALAVLPVLSGCETLLPPDRTNPHDSSNRPRALVRIQSLVPTEFGSHHLLIDDTPLTTGPTGDAGPGSLYLLDATASSDPNEHPLRVRFDVGADGAFEEFSDELPCPALEQGSNGRAGLCAIVRSSLLDRTVPVIPVLARIEDPTRHSAAKYSEAVSIPSATARRRCC